ncbi:MAG: response regulator [Pseudomonadota bacterium]
MSVASDTPDSAPCCASAAIDLPIAEVLDDIRVASASVPPETTCDAAYEVFASVPDLVSLPVVDGGCPVGLVDRSTFMQELSQPFGDRRFADLPITSLMTPNPLIADVAMPIGMLHTKLTCKRNGAMTESFVLVQEGRFVGVGTVQSLFNATIEHLSNVQKDIEAANSAKSEFLATMSHEIRTPMNGVIGVAELLLESQLSKPQREHAATILRSGEALLGLINDILDFSKIESGRLELEEAPFDLRVTIEDVVELLASEAERKGLELIHEFGVDVPRYVVGDMTRVRQIVFNLLGNAIKFTDQGHVVVRVKAIEPQANGRDSAVIKISVEDTGIGIPEDRVETVFERYAQAEKSTTRNFGGTGLGLAICRRLAECMGGGVVATSKLGEGSTFTATLALPRDASPLAMASQRTQLSGVRALIVEDHRLQRILLEAQLSSVGIVCKAVASVDDAMTAIAHAEEMRERYHIVIADYLMPGTDGEGLLSALKDWYGPKSERPPVLMLTGVRDARMAQRFLDAGASATLTKPARIGRLLDTIVAVLTGQSPHAQKQVGSEEKAIIRAAAQDPTTPAATVKGFRVLVAEDNRVNRALVQEMLDGLGCTVSCVENGRLAVDAAMKDAFDLILMDCQMPEMDGFEASRRIKDAQDEGRMAATPIVALTANAMKGDRERCLDAGMDDYMSKPVRKKALRSTIERWQAAAEDAATAPVGASAGLRAPAGTEDCASAPPT